LPTSVPVRLNRYLASAGVASRRAADEYIRAGRVTVNGAPAQLGTLIGAGDDVRVDGERVNVQAEMVVLLHKPAGVVTTVAVDPPPAVLRRLREGVLLDDGQTAPATVRMAGKGRVEITIHEGRNRQVRRMLAAVGHPARALHRSRYAGIGLGDLDPGEWRVLSEREVEALRRA
jgi:16S rRNA U516 pseudouridylate synthase RsuA-like enzyme